MPKKLFVFHQVIQNQRDFCNQLQLREHLNAGTLTGGRYVLYGRRDTGKTSLLKTVVIPHFLDHHQKKKQPAFALFCDFMGVRNREQVSARLRLALERSLAEHVPSQKWLRDLAKVLVTLRPTLAVQQDGSTTLSLTLGNAAKPDIVDVLDGIAKLSKKYPALLVFDEFQDLHGIPEIEGLLRDVFQNLSPSTGVVVLGSQKHLLAQIFSRAQAPLANWGEPVHVKPIPYDEYHLYIEERLRSQGLTMGFEDCQHLQNTLMRVPEAINIVCQRLIDTHVSGQAPVEEPRVESLALNRAHIAKAIHDYLDASSSFFEELMRARSPREEKLLVALAKEGITRSPYSQEFLALAELPAATIQKILPKLEKEATIYKETEGYFLANPLLGLYLQRYR